MNTWDITPGKFTRVGSEEPEAWINSIMLWRQYKGLKDSSAIAAAGLLLKDGPLQWYYTLDDSTLRSMEAFEEAFKKRYVYTNTNSWKDIVVVFELKQSATQSVEDFIALVLKKGKKADVPREQLVAAILKGLRQDLRQQILQHEPTTIEEIQKWGILALKKIKWRP